MENKNQKYIVLKMENKFGNVKNMGCLKFEECDFLNNKIEGYIQIQIKGYLNVGICSVHMPEFFILDFKKILKILLENNKKLNKILKNSV